jgi:hypothetical protein
MKFFKKGLIAVFAWCIIMTNISFSYAHEKEQQEDMIEIIRNALEGFRLFYELLSNSEQDDLTRMFDELIGIGCKVQDYCDTGLKHNNLMLKYKLHKNLDQLCLNAAFGCTEQTNDPIVCTNLTALEPFDSHSCLRDQDLSNFYLGLNNKEQEELNTVIMDMFVFCKKTIQDLDQLLDRYPTIKSKLKAFLAETNQELLVNIGFDYPFPSITYRII